MRNAVLIYKTYNKRFNIGDYIQSLAALQFLKEPVDYVNRETLDEYKGEPAKIILNGWFLHEPEHWPPSDKLHPLFVSFHLNSVAYNILEKDNVIEYFKKHEPIGCRDERTRDLLISKGIKAYFSGCLTLTLDKNYAAKKRKNKTVYFVDPYFPFSKDIFSLINYFALYFIHLRVIHRINRKMFKSYSFKNILKTSAFYKIYRNKFDNDFLINAEYLTHMLDVGLFKNEDEKFSYARNLLAKYSNAKMVITSRIHCALPCLSLKTPVLYTDAINNTETSACRLDGIKELFHIISVSETRIECSVKDDLLKIDNSFSFSNKRDYLDLKTQIVDIIRKCFI